MSSYYNRPWRGFVEVAALGGDWVRAIDTPIGSVEEGLALIERTEVTGLRWRIVDLGGNVYEKGVVKSKGAEVLLYEFKSYPVPDEVAARQLAYYESLLGTPPVHIAESERRRLLEEALKGEDEEDAAA